MIRKEAISIIVKELNNVPIVSANGYISRDLFETHDKPSNFYMIGSMGLSSSIGLGIALKKPKNRIHVFDGDANILMNLGSLTTIGTLQPKNLIHFVFDNSSHESTGGQPTNTSDVEIDCIAKATKFKVFRTRTKSGLVKILKKIKHAQGPIMVLVKIKNSQDVSKRVTRKPVQIKNHFMKSLD